MKIIDRLEEWIISLMLLAMTGLTFGAAAKSVNLAV